MNTTAVLNISFDDDAENPRLWSNLGTVSTTGRYKHLSDAGHGTDDPPRYIGDLIESASGKEFGEPYDKSMDELFGEFNKYYVHLPVYMYSHGGITINTTGFSCPWDSWQTGIIYVSRKTLDKRGITENDALDILRLEIDVLDKYIRGDVYSFVIQYEDEDGEEINELSGDSCSGFYGDDPRTNGMSAHIDLDAIDLINWIGPYGDVYKTETLEKETT